MRGSLATMFLLSAVNAFGQGPSQPPAAPTATDRDFVTDTGTDLDIYHCRRSIFVPVFTTRYVGPTNPDGTLQNAQAMIDAGTLLPWVELEIPAWDVDSAQGERDLVFFNGESVESMHGENYGFLIGRGSAWHRNIFRVPIQKVKFPSSPGVAGGRPSPVRNEVRIDIDSTNQGWCVEVNWVRLRIGAMSPTLVIHGNSQSNSWFLTHGFVAAFSQPFMPIDSSISFSGRSGTPSAIRRQLNSRYLKQHPQNSVQKIADRYGVDSVHLVAHSKGGLDARDYLGTRNGGPQVLTLLTLSTPHEGSVLADVQQGVNAIKAPLRFFDVQWDDFDQIYGWASSASGTNAGHADLTIPECSTFNGWNVANLPVETRYIPFAADLDLNSSRSFDTLIEASEIDLDDQNAALAMSSTQPAVHRTFLRAMDALYQTLATTRRVTVTVLPPTPQQPHRKLNVSRVAGEFHGNDILVTIPSGLGGLNYARVTSFNKTYSRGQGRNHSNIGDGGVAADARLYIIRSERELGDLKP